MKRIYTTHFLWVLLLLIGQSNVLMVAMSLDDQAPRETIRIRFSDGEQLVSVRRDKAGRAQLFAAQLSNEHGGHSSESLVLPRDKAAGFTLDEIAQLLNIDDWGAYLNGKDDAYLYRLFLLHKYLDMPQLSDALAHKIGVKIGTGSLPKGLVSQASSKQESNSALGDAEALFAEAIVKKTGFIPTAEPFIIRGHAGRVFSVAYSPDGTHIASSSDDGTVRIGDVQTGSSLSQSLEGKKTPVRSVAYSHDGKQIAYGSADGSIRILDAQTRDQIGKPLKGHTDSVNSVAYSPDGTHIVSGSWDNTVRIWDALTGEQVGEPLQGHTDLVNSVAYSPDGRQIVSGSCDRTVRIWDAHTRLPLGAPLQGHTSSVFSVAYSPDGKHIASGSRDRTVRIWNLSTRTQVGEPLQGHTAAVTSVAYNPDGEYIASASLDGSVRIWHVSTRMQIAELLHGKRREAYSVAWSPDGSRIASGSVDNVLVWGKLLDGHMVQAEEWIKREMEASSSSGNTEKHSRLGEKRVRSADDKRSLSRSPKRNHFEEYPAHEEVRPADAFMFDQLLPAYNPAEEDDADLQEALKRSLEDTYRPQKASEQSRNSNWLRDNAIDHAIKELKLKKQAEASRLAPSQSASSSVQRSQDIIVAKEQEDSSLRNAESASAVRSGKETAPEADAVSEPQEKPKTEQELMREARLKKFGKQ